LATLIHLTEIKADLIERRTIGKKRKGKKALDCREKESVKRRRNFHLDVACWDEVCAQR